MNLLSARDKDRKKEIDDSDIKPIQPLTKNNLMEGDNLGEK